MINFSKISTFLIAVLFVISSCSKDSPSVEKSNENELISLKITKNDNPQLQGDVLIYKFQRDYYITLPLGTDLSNVKASFEYSPKAKMIINSRSTALIIKQFCLSPFRRLKQTQVLAHNKTQGINF